MSIIKRRNGRMAFPGHLKMLKTRYGGLTFPSSFVEQLRHNPELMLQFTAKLRAIQLLEKDGINSDRAWQSFYSLLEKHGGVPAEIIAEKKAEQEARKSAIAMYAKPQVPAKYKNLLPKIFATLPLIPEGGPRSRSRDLVAEKLRKVLFLAKHRNSPFLCEKAEA